MNSKKDIRPTIPQVLINNDTSQEERFQNTVLRSILKMQHELLLMLVMSHLQKKRIDIMDLPTVKKEQTLRNVLKSDMALKNELRGMIIGQMEIEEFKEYLLLQVEMNKRITNMLTGRIINGIIELEIK
ncbi:MAG: hypothetical protein NWS46_12470 [Cyclobacteriaceae bacterium]|jgi:hypothetical protein|nr:hypothetical protein [Cyclobacteriaceae bacterium]